MSLFSANSSDVSRLALQCFDLMPCELGKASFISAFNTGGPSTGLAVAFSGSYVEHEELRFCDVQLEYDVHRHPRPAIPLSPEKMQMGNGQWAWYAELPQFRIPDGIKPLPTRRSADAQHKRSFGVRFTPQGNARKLLDPDDFDLEE